ncbi:MAG: hypothetical protein QXG00_06055 [Candidatus Woesearchaeota archaeon]
MNSEYLKKFLTEKGIYRRTTANGKNFECFCIFCNDHKDDKKAKHLYVSTCDNVYHCWLCQSSGTITNLIKKLTSDSVSVIKHIFTEEELRKTKQYKNGNTGKIIQKVNTVKYTLPEIARDDFLAKRKYIKQRIDFQGEIEEIPNLIFDIKKFISINKLDDKVPKTFNFQFLNDNYVAFLLHNHSMIICRSISEYIPFKFVKIPLQDRIENLSDYYVLFGNKYPDSKLVVLSEGIFDILGCYFSRKLNFHNDINMYVSCQGFDGYSNVLKSLCFDFHLFNIDVVILSDSDKKIQNYKNILSKNIHNINSFQIYYNKGKKDFGTFPVEPVQGGKLK